MGEKEAHYRSALRSASLVVEADYDRGDVDNILAALGSLYAYLARRGDPAERAFDRYPHCLLVGMVGTAAIAPEANTFWPEFWRATKIHPDQDLQRFVGDAFLQALGRARLPQFTDVVAHRRFVGPAAMHAAIPNSGMHRLVDVILARRRHDPGLAGADLLTWLTANTGRLNYVDSSVGRFLQFGDELALDVLDRVIEVVAHAGEHLGSLDDGTLSTETTGLPSVMLTALVEELHERRHDLVIQPAPLRRKHRTEPTVALDVGAGAVVVMLPAVSAEDGAAVWSVAGDGATESIRAAAQWVGKAATTTPLAAAVRQPVRRLNVRLRGQERLDVELVDPSDPLLLFDVDGQLLPAGLPVPRGEVWAVIPKDKEVVDVAGTPLRIMGQLGQPVGWRGWLICSLDLQNASAVRLSDAASTVRPRLVRSSGAPSIEGISPLAAVTTRRGMEVSSTRPTVVLPPGSDPSQWQVEVLRPDDRGRGVVRMALAECPQIAGGHDPLHQFGSPLLGEFTISVRGAFGKKAQRTVFVAEGLGVDVAPRLRWTTAGLLDPAAATIRPAPGMTTSSSALSFDADTVQSDVTCEVGLQARTILIRPPAVEVQVTGQGLPGGWTSRPPIVHAETFDAQAFLSVRLPGDNCAYRLELSADDADDRQSIESTDRRGRETRLFSLGRFADTARRVGSGRFDLVGIDSRSTVALLRPRTFASGARAVDRGLQLDDLRYVEGLHAATYRNTAPWLPPVVREVDESGFVQLGDELKQAGPLLVSLAVVDPWAPTDWPDWPGPTALQVARPGHHEAVDSGSELLSAALAGAPVPDDGVVTDLTAVWPVLDLEDRLPLPTDTARRVRRLVLDSLHSDPPAALSSLMFQVRDRAAAVRLLIRAGLVERRFRDIEQDAIRRGWASAPVLAALAAVPQWRKDEWSDNSGDDLRRSLALGGGESLVAILDSRHDPHREVGGFGPTASALDQLDPARVEDLWSAVQVVPEGLLHPDSRMAAAKQLFDARREKELTGVLAFIERDLSRVRKCLVGAAPPDLFAQFEARLDGTPTAAWGLLPAASFGWAALARLRAYNSAAVPLLGDGRREAWFVLATHAPDYVGMDIVLADAHAYTAATASKKRDHHG
ncbi:hypothetical protein UXQ13_11630 [Klenkia terrae]|uniref:Uncharacterized protein n=2 Tax=Klenkia terrae TaxID=1052259 RepID=A0ABU8E6E5_9ACTN